MNRHIEEIHAAARRIEAISKEIALTCAQTKNAPQKAFSPIHVAAVFKTLRIFNSNVPSEVLDEMRAFLLDARV